MYYICYSLNQKSILKALRLYSYPYSSRIAVSTRILNVFTGQGMNINNKTNVPLN